MASNELDTRGNGSAATPAVPSLASKLTWPDRTGEQPAIPEQLLPALVAACESIPTEGDTGGYGAILEALLRATTIDDLNKPWNGTSGRELAGRRLSIRSLVRRPSQFEDGPELFLVASCADVKTGEELTMTTSALAVVVQLAMAHSLGMLPILAEVVVAEKPTERGYYPYHLNVLAASSPTAAATDRPGF